MVELYSDFLSQPFTFNVGEELFDGCKAVYGEHCSEAPVDYFIKGFNLPFPKTIGDFVYDLRRAGIELELEAKLKKKVDISSLLIPFKNVQEIIKAFDGVDEDID
jgi:hypothetical protein